MKIYKPRPSLIDYPNDLDKSIIVSEEWYLEIFSEEMLMTKIKILKFSLMLKYVSKW